MARVHGRNGNIYVGLLTSAAAAEPLLFTSKWSLEAKTDRQDATSFGDSTKTYVAGLPDSSLSFEGYYNNASDQTWTAALDGQPRNFYLYPGTPATTADYFYGTAFFDFTIDASVDDVVKVKGTANAATPIARS